VRWPAAELALALGAAAATAVLVHLVVATSNLSAPSLVTPGVGPVWAALMILLAVAAHVAQRRSVEVARARFAVALLAGVATALVSAPLTVGLRGTNQPLNTILGGDMAFRTEYVTRFASTWHLQDYTFKGLDAFYPPAWFWVAGRAAHYLGLQEPWHIMKPFTILTIGAALLVAYLLWRTVLSPAGALSAAIGSSLVLRSQVGPVYFATQSWYEPYSCFVAVTGAAWVAATLRALRLPDARGRLLLLGLLGAVLALTYYLLFLILVLVLITLAVLPHPARRDALKRLAVLTGGVAVLTAVFWIPLVGAVLHGGASQGQFVTPEFLRVFVGIGSPLALTVLVLVAIVALALTFTSPNSQVVAGLVAATVVYQLVSVTTLVFAHQQLQPHRAITMMWATIGAALPVTLDGFQPQGAFRRLLQPPLPRLLGVLAAAAAIPAIFVLGATQGSDLAGGPFTMAAHQPVPLARTKAMSRYIRHTTGKRPQQLTIVSGVRALLVTRPYYGFLPLRPRYAHPEAHLAQRIEVLRAAARCPDPACTTRALTRSKFGPIDALVLARTIAGLRIQTQEDVFPKSLPTQVYFRPGNFDPAAWVRRNFGSYAVLVRRAAASR
jgi:galactan 5-O-arabinofuranosyltransferase